MISQVNPRPSGGGCRFSVFGFRVSGSERDLDGGVAEREGNGEVDFREEVVPLDRQNDLPRENRALLSVTPLELHSGLRRDCLSDSHHPFVAVSVGTILCPCGIAYHSAYGLSNSGLF